MASFKMAGFCLLIVVDDAIKVSEKRMKKVKC